MEKELQQHQGGADRRDREHVQAFAAVAFQQVGGEQESRIDGAGQDDGSDPDHERLS